MQPPSPPVGPPGAPACTVAALPLDMLRKVFLELGFADVFQACKVLSSFAKMAGQALLEVYGLEHEGKVYLNWSKVLYEFDKLVRVADPGGSEDEVTKMLYQIEMIQSVIKAKLGRCIKYAPGVYWSFNRRASIGIS